MLKLRELSKFPRALAAFVTRKRSSGTAAKHRRWRGIGGPEMLEVRCLPAATLSASLVNGQLEIVDSDAVGKDNLLTVSVLGTNLIINDAHEQFVGAPAGGTLSDSGQTLTIPLSLVTSGLIINGGGGDDGIDIDSLTALFSGNLTIHGGAGSDTVTFQTSTINVGGGNVNVDAESITVNSGLTAGGAINLSSSGDDARLTINAAVSAGADSKFTADKMLIGAAVNITAHVLTLVPESSVDAGDQIDIGATGDSAANTLELSDAELDRITAATLVIGDLHTSTITISAAIQLAGDSNVQVVTGRNIVSELGTAWSTRNGDLSMTANPTATAIDSFWGISLNGMTLNSTGTGDISLDGHGGQGGIGNNGIMLYDGSRLLSTGTGRLSLTGVGGSGSQSDHGIKIEDVGTRIASVTGNISIHGQGGTSTTSYGVFIFNGAVIESTGTATMTIDGTGADTDVSNGVTLSAQTADTRILSANGDINIIGHGGDTAAGYATRGIAIYNNVLIQSTGTAKINLDGTGGDSLGSSRGIEIFTGSRITSAIGDIQITGHGGNNASAYGVWMLSGSIVDSTGVARVSIDGTGGNAGDAIGVLLEGTHNGTRVSSVDGDITITGHGGTFPGDGTTRGIALVSGAIVKSTGEAKVKLNGTAESGTQGVDISEVGTEVSSVNGDIVIVGQGGRIVSAYGIWVRNGAVVKSTGTAHVILSGTAGNTADGMGVLLTGDGLQTTVSTVNGEINVTGFGGHAPGQSIVRGVTMLGGAQMLSTGTGQIVVHGVGGIGAEIGTGVELRDPGTLISSVAGTIRIDAQGGTPALSNGLWVHQGAVISSTGAARIDIDGVGGTGNDAMGVTVQGMGSRISSAAGDIDIHGQGGDSAASHGVWLDDGGAVESSGTAQIIIDGIGGTGASDSRGVQLSGANSKITSVDGAVHVTGHGGSGITDFNIGVWLVGGPTISSTGRGSITIDGTGGSGINENSGVILNGFGNGGNTNVSAVDGDITIIGHGTNNGTGAGNRGIGLYSGAFVQSTGRGKITLDGTGGTGSDSSRGVEIVYDNTRVQSANGDIQITGHGGANTSSYGVWVLDGGAVKSTGAAKITLNGTGGDANDSVGVAVNTGMVTSKDGDITITGQGGQSATGDGMRGVWLLDGASIESAGQARITIEGTGGTGTNSQRGVDIASATKISSKRGDILIVGHGGTGTQETDTYCVGVTIADDSVVESTATTGTAAKITIDGTGGSGSGNDLGVWLSAGHVASNSGDIHIIGQGGIGTRFNHFGVTLQFNALVESTGSAKIIVDGTGGNGLGSANGIYVGSGSAVQSVDGDIVITGVGGGDEGSGGNQGIDLQNGSVNTVAGGSANITIVGTPGPNSNGIYIETTTGNTALNTSAGTGEMTLVTDRLVVNSDAASETINAGANTVTIRPLTAGLPIDLGGNDAVGLLALSDAKLDLITAGTLQIGGPLSGDLTVTADISRATATDIRLVTGGNLVISSGSIATAGGTLELATSSPPNVINPLHGGVDVVATTTILHGDLSITLNGTGVDTEFTQLNVVGSVDLNGVRLLLSGSDLPGDLDGISDSFVIVNNDSDDAVVGTFQGLSEGTLLAFNGRTLKITYHGGTDGNDVVLTTTTQPPVANDAILPVTENQPASGILPGSDADSLTLTYRIISNPAHGVVTITDAATGAYTYTPTTNYAGLDSFTFVLNDGLRDSNIGTISIGVIETNKPPQLSLNGTDVTFDAKAAKDSEPIRIVPEITVADVNQSPEFGVGGGTLTLSIDVSGNLKKKTPKLNDTIGGLLDAAALGTTTGPVFKNGKLILTVSLNANTTTAAIQTFLRGLTFTTKGPGLREPLRIFQVKVADAAGATSNFLKQTIHVKRK